jgi:hypothetical protein
MKLHIEVAARATSTESAEQSQLPMFLEISKKLTSLTQDHWDCLF